MRCVLFCLAYSIQHDVIILRLLHVCCVCRWFVSPCHRCVTFSCGISQSVHPAAVDGIWQFPVFYCLRRSCRERPCASTSPVNAGWGWEGWVMAWVCVELFKHCHTFPRRLYHFPSRQHCRSEPGPSHPSQRLVWAAVWDMLVAVVSHWFWLVLPA